MNIAANIKALRNERGLTQMQLANGIGVRQSVISAWEIGKSQPLPDGLIALASFFSCSVDYILGREDEGGVISMKNDNRRNLLAEELNEVYIKLNSFYKGMLVGYARTLLKEQQERA